MSAEVKLAWHDQWQSRTRGGHEVICIRPTEGGLTASLWMESGYFDSFFYPPSGQYHEFTNQESELDLLPVASVIP